MSTVPLRAGWLLALGLPLAACSLAPAYQAPKVDVVPAYKEAGDWLPVQAVDTAPRDRWWDAYGDAQLDELQQRLKAGNQDLQAGVARLDQARALTQGATSRLYPSLGAAAAATRARRSANAPTSAGVASTRTDLQASLGLSWEIDLLGRLRNEAAASRDRTQAVEADLAALELVLRAELASDYFALRGADATVQLLEDTVQLYGRALDLTRNRYEAGIAAAADVDQAQAQLASTQAQRSAVIRQRAQLEHAIAVLVGLPPAAFALPSAPFLAQVPALAPGQPSTLLLRRPDLARAERAVAAANAEIGVARAAWFPVFSLGAAGGYEAQTTASWFSAPSRFWAAGPALAVPLLDVGARSALTRRAHAAFEEAAAAYRQSALNAYREVEDNLAALRELAEELDSQETAASAAKSAAYHADERYRAGIADYIEVTSTQTTLLQAQRAALAARVQQLGASIALVRALGGGWGYAVTPGSAP